MADLETEVPRLLEFWLSTGVLVIEEDAEEEEDDGQVAAADDEEVREADEQDEPPPPPFAPLVEVPRDFLVGGSSRGPPLPFIEFRLPWDGLLLFSLLERLLDDVPAVAVDGDWPEGVGELFTGALRRSPIIVALAIVVRVWSSYRDRCFLHGCAAVGTSTLTEPLMTRRRRTQSHHLDHSRSLARNTATSDTQLVESSAMPLIIPNCRVSSVFSSGNDDGDDDDDGSDAAPGNKRGTKCDEEN